MNSFQVILKLHISTMYNYNEDWWCCFELLWYYYGNLEMFQVFSNYAYLSK